MALIVQKFGGDALGDKGKGREVDLQDLHSSPPLLAEKFHHVARIVKQSVDRGDQVIVTVSAFGDTTNRLLRMAAALCEKAPARELDMLMATGEQQSVALLALALHAQGVDGVSFTGPQVGIRTDEIYGASRIQSIDGEKLRALVAAGKVPIVAGFQGSTANNEITTLGRGGSDITAVALAGAAGADSCEFYKDVDGIFTTDPRICPSARKIDRISYDEMLELASLGAGILHSRSVEFAKKYDVPLHVRSFLHNEPGTIVTAEDKAMEQVVVSGIAFNKDEAKISVLGVPDKPGVAAELFSRLGTERIVVDVIIQSTARDNTNAIAFTVAKKDFTRAVAACEKIAKDIGAKSIETDEKIAKVSAVGVGMRSHTGVAGKMFKALAESGINIQMISTSEIKISVVIAEEDMEKAVQVTHKAFEDQSEFAITEEKTV
ncbi:MAG: aspartate kinase [Candidatus Sumerlaeota bacterium]|nr:aspartate kinase [Candidatus Sumerlaeota bacterium]